MFLRQRLPRHAFPDTLCFWCNQRLPPLGRSFALVSKDGGEVDISCSWGRETRLLVRKIMPGRSMWSRGKVVAMVRADLFWSWNCRRFPCRGIWKSRCCRDGKIGFWIGYDCFVFARWLVFVFWPLSIQEREQYLILGRYLFGYTTRASCESHTYFVFWCFCYPLVLFQECMRVVCHFEALRHGLGSSVKT